MGYQKQHLHFVWFHVVINGLETFMLLLLLLIIISSAGYTRLKEERETENENLKKNYNR